MDISCEMELPFSESSTLTGTPFESSSSDLPVKLLGSSDDHLLHGNSDKHLSASDFKLDLGPANDLVSAADFDHGMSSDSLLIPEESSEGYSISDAALEGGARPVITAANIVTIDSVNYVQSIPIVSTLSGIQAVQVIPFGYLISGSKPNLEIQSKLIPVPAHVNNLTHTNATHIQPVHNAVVIGNVMMLPGKQIGEAQFSNTEQVKLNMGTSDKCSTMLKSTKVDNTGEMSRRVAHKKSMISTRIQHPRNKMQSQQKNAKVKIDGKTISLTFEVKNVGTHIELTSPTQKNPESLEVKSPNNHNNSSRQDLTKSPKLQIVTDVKNMASKTKYVSLLNGRNNCITLKKHESSEGMECETTNETMEMTHTDEMQKEVLSDNVSKDIKKDKLKMSNDRTTELENEVLTLLAKASEERSRVEQSKMAVGRKKSGKPGGNFPNSENLFTCDICGLAFNRHGNFTRHKLIHDVQLKDRYKCPECDRKFLQRCDLKRHLLIHSNQEPYRCQECGKGYIRRSDLVVHLRFHKKERVFACPYCVDKKFCQSGDLNRHIRNVHLQSSSFGCRKCERQFSRDSALIQHEYTCHAAPLLHTSRKKQKSGHLSSTGTKVTKKKKNEMT